MKRTFVTNLILLVGVNLLIKPFYLLVVESEIQNRVGAETFGSYFALINFSFILNVLLDAGTTNWNTRHVAHNQEILSRQLSGMVTLRLLLCAAYLVISLSIGCVLDYNAQQMIILVVLAITQILSSAVLYLRSYLTGMHLFRQDSIISIMDRIILVIMMSTLLWTNIAGDGIFKIEWLVWGQLIAYSITSLVAFIIVVKKSGRLHPYFDIRFMRNVMRESIPYALLMLLTVIAYRVDSVMLERLSGAEEAGIYAMGFRFFEAINMIAYLFAVLLLPIFARMLKHGDDISPLLQLSFRILFSGTFIITAFCFFFGENILSLIYDRHIAEANEAFSWLMIGALFFSLQYIFGTLITASGNMRTLIYISLLAMIYNVTLNIFFIPALGAVGAAKASCFTQFIVLLAQVSVVYKRFNVGPVTGLGLRTLAFVAICISSGIIFSSDTISLPGPAYSCGLFLIVTLAGAVATRMLDLKRFIQLIKSGE